MVLGEVGAGDCDSEVDEVWLCAGGVCEACGPSEMVKEEKEVSISCEKPNPWGDGWG